MLGIEAAGRGPCERDPARRFCANGRPDRCHRPAEARTCGGVKFAVVPVPVMGGPAVGSLAHLGVEAGDRGRGSAPAALPPGQLN
jgi:hypothetical protein